MLVQVASGCPRRQAPCRQLSTYVGVCIGTEGGIWQHSPLPSASSPHPNALGPGAHCLLQQDSLTPLFYNLQRGQQQIATIDNSLANKMIGNATDICMKPCLSSSGFCLLGF